MGMPTTCCQICHRYLDRCLECEPLKIETGDQAYAHVQYRHEGGPL